ncbi:MAG: hypothetical protein ACYS9X_13085 [Planctomycetota bacterium]|jgi:hypothetical protein
MTTEGPTDLAMTSAILAAGLLACPVCGCKYVPMVVGRPAAVLPRGAKGEPGLAGAGVWRDRYRDTSTGESSELTVPYPVVALEEGLGHRMDMQGGMQGMRAFGVLRWQALGRPYAVDPARSRPSFDVSLEAGASFLIFLMVKQIDGHLGVNASVPLGRVTPYVSVRYHWANSDAAGWDSRQEEWRMLYLGAEFRLRRGRSLVVEVFRGDLEHYDPVYGDSLEVERYGLNVLCRKVSF